MRTVWFVKDEEVTGSMVSTWDQSITIRPDVALETSPPTSHQPDWIGSTPIPRTQTSSVRLMARHRDFRALAELSSLLGSRRTRERG